MSVPQQVFSRSFGQGPRQVLALHCTLAHSGAWRALVAAMGDETTFATFDMFTHGRSPDWDGQGDYQDRNVEVAEQFLTDRMDLIGHSFGATLALRLAVAHPERVRSLTMIEPVYFAVARQDNPQVVAEHDEGAAAFMDVLAAGDHALAARVFNRMWGEGGARWPDLPEKTRAAMTRSIPMVLACQPSIYEDRPGMLAPGVLDRVTMPTLVLRGATSHPVIGVVNDGLARRLPDAQSLIVDGAGHMLPITHPDETAAHLRALFSRTQDVAI